MNILINIILIAMLWISGFNIIKIAIMELLRFESNMLKIIELLLIISIGACCVIGTNSIMHFFNY